METIESVEIDKERIIVVKKVTYNVTKLVFHPDGPPPPTKIVEIHKVANGEITLVEQIKDEYVLNKTVWRNDKV